MTAFIIVMLCGKQFIAMMQARQIGQVVRDNGPESHFSKKGVPTMGGLLIILAVAMSTLLWVDLHNHLVWLVLGITLWYGTIGAYDDYRKIKMKNSAGLSGRKKLLLQIAGAALMGWLLSAHQAFDGHVSLPFFKDISPNLGDWYVLFAILVIVGASNAVNLTDGLDGLATGPTIITSAVYLLFSYLAGHAVLASYLGIPYVEGAGELAVFCGALVGASLGFLWFNAFPA
ncbi:MAG: phospho-N-acetylmuramoyl-pentapeptide-transferase, partial [Desulfobulbaceae bacterium]|nr:phospho-N-acetylmuramoyl-pentapeptide-transferase [Desulfobulbaceae bacterium]